MTPWRLRCACGGDIPLLHTDNGDVICSACGVRSRVEDGIVSLAAPEASDEDYPAAIVDLIADVEDRHFWFAARNHVILSTMRRVIGPLAGKRALDIGCGTGFVLAGLDRAGLVTAGIDMHRSSLLRARTRTRGPLIWSGATRLPFFDDLEVVVLCDVIEHATSDQELLREAARVLKPGGFIVVTVPAGQHLWTPYDEASGHKRRYDRADLSRALTASGYTVRFVSYFNVLPLIAQVLHRTLTASPGSHDPVDIVRTALRVPPEPINSMLGALVRLEAPLRALKSLRGGSLIAVAQVNRV